MNRIKITSAKDYKAGDIVKTNTGHIGIVKKVTGGRYVVIDFKGKNIDKVVYIPAHGELRKFGNG